MIFRLLLIALIVSEYGLMSFLFSPTLYRKNFDVHLSSMASGDSSMKPKMKVVVTGCSAGSVGYHVVKRMIRSKKLKAKYDVVGLCKSKKDKKHLLEAGVESEQIVIGDITRKSDLEGLFANVTKVVLCTSAQPKKKMAFHLKNFFRSFIGKNRSPRIQELYYEKHQTPYYVDFIGKSLFKKNISQFIY